MHPAIAQKRSDIAQLCKVHHVLRLEVVGSAARGTDFDPQRSDADFVVEFEPRARKGFESYFAVKRALEELLRRHVDLIEAGALRNPYVIASINAAREVIYAA
jgi:predicted nucleotidyltransferase